MSTRLRKTLSGRREFLFLNTFEEFEDRSITTKRRPKKRLVFYDGDGNPVGWYDVVGELEVAFPAWSQHDINFKTADQILSRKSVCATDTVEIVLRFRTTHDTRKMPNVKKQEIEPVFVPTKTQWGNWDLSWQRD